MSLFGVKPVEGPMYSSARFLTSGSILTTEGPGCLMPRTSMVDSGTAWTEAVETVVATRAQAATMAKNFILVIGWTIFMRR